MLIRYMLLVRHLHKLRWSYMFHALQYLLLSLEAGHSVAFSHVSSLSVFCLLLSSFIMGYFCTDSRNLFWIIIAYNNNYNRNQRRYSRFLQSPHSAANCFQFVCSSGHCANVCKSRATHRAHITCKCHVTCHLVRRDSSAIQFDRVQIAFIWALFYCCCCWLVA